MWEKKINKIDDIYNNPAKFWRKITQMMGSNASNTNYSLDKRKMFQYNLDKYISDI